MSSVLTTDICASAAKHNTCYPVVLIPDGYGYLVYITDFRINTEGYSYAEAIAMAKDAICLMIEDLECDGKEVPTPSRIENIPKEHENDVVVLVDIDFAEYCKGRMKLLKDNSNV